MEKLLCGKTAIVTGGSRGIGKAIVLELAKHGANVVFSYHSSEAKAMELVKEIEGIGAHSLAVKSDAASFLAAKELCDATVAKFAKIDIVVNNAGITLALCTLECMTPFNISCCVAIISDIR